LLLEKITSTLFLGALAKKSKVGAMQLLASELLNGPSPLTKLSPPHEDLRFMNKSVRGKHRHIDEAYRFYC
jgi:hypothetical protein